MKKIILFLLITLFFTSCAVSSLNVEEDSQLVLKQNSKDYKLGVSQGSNFLRFMNIDVLQSSVISNTKTSLFHEKVLVDHAYEFSRGSIETLKIIFDLSKSNLLYRSGNLLFLQLQFQEDKYINLFVEKSSIQDISYLYGYSNDELMNLAASLDIKLDAVKMRPAVIVTQPLSKWSQTRLILEPLLQPFDKRGRF